MLENVLVEKDFSNFKKFIDKYSTGKKFYIVDKKVFDLYRKELNVDARIILFDADENNKNLKSLMEIVDKLLDLKITRLDTIVGIGGGVLCDVVGFVSGIIYRGIRHIFVATTLLCAVDAVYGGKCAIDYNGYKNVLGLFKQPYAIYISEAFFNTLTEIEKKSGYGEIIKYSYLGNIDFNSKTLINDCLSIKDFYVSQDFLDQGKRMMLNLGHTFGHLIELEYNIPHGIAVVNGIKMILDLEYDLGILKDLTLLKDLEVKCDAFGIKLGQYDYKKYLKKIFSDKKNFGGTLNLVFIDSNKQSYLYQVKEGDISV